MLREKLERVLFYLLLLFLPTQLGKHFWPDFAIISGVRVDYLSPTLYFTDMLIGILFSFWVINRHSGKRGTSASRIRTVITTRDSGRNSFARMTRSKSIYLLLFAFLLFNIYLSQNYLNGLYHFIKLLEFSFVAYYVATSIKTFVQVKTVFFFLGMGVIWESVLAIIQFIKQGALGGVFYFVGERMFTAATPGIANASINGELLLRPYGTFPHPNVLAGFLLISMIGLLFTSFWAKGLERRLWASALLLGSSALLLTMSRTAIVLWILLLLSVLILSLRAEFKRGVATSYKIASSFLLAMTITVGLLLLFMSPFGARMLQTSVSEEAFVQRIVLTQASIVLTAEQPVIGVGLGNFLPMLAAVATSLPLNLYLQPVHNIFLLLLAETGIVGLGIFIWLLAKTYKRLFRLIKKEGGIPYRLFVVLLSVVLVLGSFDHYFLTLQQGQLLFALILGLSWTRLRG